MEEILQGIDDVNFSVLDASDVVRHRLVGDIVNAYGIWDDGTEEPGKAFRDTGTSGENTHEHRSKQRIRRPGG